MSLLELFCHVDDFCQALLPHWQREQWASGLRQRQRARGVSLSEVMTILIHFQQSHYRDVKAFDTEHVLQHLRAEFPGLVSYTRCVACIPETLMPLCLYLRYCSGACSDISFLDSTTLALCHNRRIHQHKVFAGLAARGQSSVGWCYGCKLHLVFNDQGERLNIALTPGNVDDRKPVPKRVRRLFGKRFGDKGYLSRPLFEQLRSSCGIQLITKLKRNRLNPLMPLADKLRWRKRAIVETMIDQLKNISQIEHSRHRSPFNFLVNRLCGLIADCHQPKKPSLHLDGRLMLPAA